MKLGKTVASPSLNGVSCVGASLCSQHVLGVFGRKVGSEVSMDGWGVLSAVTFIGGNNGDGEVEPGPLVNLGFSDA